MNMTCQANLRELPAAGEVDDAGGEAAEVGGRGGGARAREAAGGPRGGEYSGSVERPAEAGLPWCGRRRGREEPRRPYQHHRFLKTFGCSRPLRLRERAGRVDKAWVGHWGLAW
jgi:hypothetical protein